MDIRPAMAREAKKVSGTIVPKRKAAVVTFYFAVGQAAGNPADGGKL